MRFATVFVVAVLALSGCKSSSTTSTTTTAAPMDGSVVRNNRTNSTAIMNDNVNSNTSSGNNGSESVQNLVGGTGADNLADPGDNQSVGGLPGNVEGPITLGVPSLGEPANAAAMPGELNELSVEVTAAGR